MRFSIALVLALAAAFGARAQPADGARFTAPGPQAFDVVRTEWADPARERALPIKIVAARGLERMPVILFSHGLGGSREGGTAWGEHWASHGYVVVHLQHPGSDEALWANEQDRGARRRALLRAASGEQLLARVRDVRFVIDEIERRVGAREAPWTRVDIARIGMSGHSFGAVTTQAIAGDNFGRPRRGDVRDARVRAALAFSPSARGGEEGLDARFGGIAIPFMSVTGTADGDPLGGAATPENRRLPFGAMRAPDKYLVVFDGAEHMVFNGQPGAIRYDPAHAERYYGAIKTVTLAYWDATLKGDATARAWLRDGTAARALGRLATLESK